MSTLLTVRLANDLRALLRLMSLCVDSLRQRVSPEENDRDFIELEGAIDSAFHLSRQLMAVGRPVEAIEPQVVDIHELLVQMEGVLARVLGPRVRVVLRLEATEAIVLAEAVQLEWALLNLAANSRSAMPTGGEFVVQTTTVQRPSTAPGGASRTLQLTVSDTGHGFYGEAGTRAFEPFFSTTQDAAGLGLTSVAFIVRSFQGWLHIESSRIGTRVNIHLPALTPARG